MSTTYIPTQHRINDPYQQRVLQFNHQDSRVYLSRISNYLLKAFGNDAVIRGFDIVSYGFVDDSNVFEVVVDSGTLLQDTTLIEVTEQSTLSIDVSGFDDCSGYLLVYTDYQYIESIGQNRFSLKIAHVSDGGLVFTTDTGSINWIAARNRIYLTSFMFNVVDGSTNTVQEKTFPEYLYLNGRRYDKRGGLLNFYRSTDPSVAEAPFFFDLAHEFDSTNSTKLITQLIADNGDLKPITNLQLQSSKISVSVDEYKPITDSYRLISSYPDDANVFSISSTSIPSGGSSIGIYELEHNLDQKYCMVEVYDDQWNLFRPHYINFTDANTITISFKNILNDLAPSYNVVLITDYMVTIPITIDESTEELVTIEHNLNRLNVITQLVDPSDNLYNNINNTLFNVSVKNNITFNTDTCDLVEGTYNINVYMNTYKIFNLFNSNNHTIPFHVFPRRLIEQTLDDDNHLSIEHPFEDLLPAVGTFSPYFKDINFPSDVHIVNSDQVDFVYNDIITPSDISNSKGYIYSFEGNSVHSLTSLSSGSSGSTFTYTLDVTDLFHVNPVFQVFEDDYLIFPEEIREVTPNEVYEFDFPNDIDPTNIKILVIQGAKNYTKTFEPNLVLIPYPVYIRQVNMTTVDEYNVLTVEHNFNDTAPALGMLDQDSSIAYADEMTVVSADEVSYTFKEVDGETDNIAYVYSFEDNTVHSIDSLPCDTTPIGYVVFTLDITAYNHTNPIFQVYNSSHQLIFPKEIREITANQVYEFEFPNTFDPTLATILVIQGYDTYSGTFVVDEDHSYVPIEHWFESSYLFVQVFDTTTGLVVFPKDIIAYSDVVLMIITTDMTVGTTYKYHIAKSPPELVPVLVTHNLDSEYLLIQLSDTATNQVIYPENIRVLDNNSIHIYLSGTSVYKVNIATGLLNRPFGVSYTNGFYYEFSDEYLEDGEITITHNLDFAYPIVQVYDNENNQVYPKEINIVNRNSVKLIFPSDLEVLQNFKVMILSTSKLQ